MLIIVIVHFDSIKLYLSSRKIINSFDHWIIYKHLTSENAPKKNNHTIKKLLYSRHEFVEKPPLNDAFI